MINLNNQETVVMPVEPEDWGAPVEQVDEVSACCTKPVEEEGTGNWAEPDGPKDRTGTAAEEGL